jgi:3-phosphoshikimate 1-carboxyvinyltransferase
LSNKIIIKKKINPFKKIIKVSGDKSLSIRWVLLSSLASGVSRADNLLLSEDVLAAKRISLSMQKILEHLAD